MNDARSGGGPVRILTYTTLYPNARQEAHGIFVENRLLRLVADGLVKSRVVAPVPWFPLAHPAFGSYAAYTGIGQREERSGLTVDHPRYPVVPKIGTGAAAALLYLATRGHVRRLLGEEGGVDLIDAHYFYPDGVAAVRIGREMGLPVVITARGSDVTLLPRFALPRRQILWAARHAAGIVTVCRALKDDLVAMGVDGAKIRVLRNGVDLDRFRPPPRDGARSRLGLKGPTVLSVGLLIPRKGHDIVIEALAQMPEASLLIAGEGPERGRLERLAAEMGMADRVRFLGVVPHDRLAEVYGAADVTVLASSREGWANVLLESMACGTAVVASAIPGNDEVVTTPAAGRLFAPRTAQALAAELRALLADPPQRSATRAYAEAFSWDVTTAGQVALFRDILGRASRPEMARA